MIRRARKSDHEAVARMWNDLLRSQGELDDRFAPSEDAAERWANDFPVWLTSLSRRMYVAEADGEVCGFVTAEQWTPPPVYQDRPGVYIDELYVRPAHRRSGFGSRLVQAVRDWAEELGARQIRAGVLIDNDEGAAFWKQIGAAPIVQTYALDIDGNAEEERSARRIGFSL